ncbi:hypothetical protein [Alloyangia pacifica]|uniref:hypothetical protein n=1 Tax=Alloyangia pacifica TaxID=311180 RepID=UPI001CFD92A2|nr:hypothetical protein [Alloyangia pacifica]
MSEYIRSSIDMAPEPWMLCRADADALERIREELLSWRSLIANGQDLMALGAAVNYLDGALSRAPRGCGVRIGWTDCPDDMEVVACDIDFSDDGIILDVTEFVPTGQGNSCDHGSVYYTHLGPDGGYDTRIIQLWLNDAAMHKSGSARFTAEVSRLPEY